MTSMPDKKSFPLFEIYTFLLIGICALYIIANDIKQQFDEVGGILYMFPYKTWLESARDNMFCIFGIIGGTLALVKNRYAWGFINFFAVGIICTLVISYFINIWGRDNQLWLIRYLFAFSAIVIYNIPKLLSNHGIIRPRLYLLFFFGVIVFSILITLLIDNYYDNLWDSETLYQNYDHSELMDFGASPAEGATSEAR